jgi:hypothetical protein
MKHGDISNHTAPVVVFSLENLVLRQTEKKKWGVNLPNVRYINELFWTKLDYTVVFSTFLPEKKLGRIEDLLDTHGVLFNRVTHFDTTSDLIMYLDTVDGSYFDSDELMVELVGPSRAFIFSEWKES